MTVLMSWYFPSSMSEPCNCDDSHCSGNKQTHKHENGKCVHADGSVHVIHE